jgi:hypothetical protein
MVQPGRDTVCLAERQPLVPCTVYMYSILIQLSFLPPLPADEL